MIDRIAPTQRPAGSPRGYQRWQSLLFLHWSVDIDLLRSQVPDELELDLYAGKAYVGVVPFEMEGVRPAWLPEALSFTFLETNVRTYVTYRDRPGVYFFSLDAAHGPAVWAARTFWGLPYFKAHMTVQHDEQQIDYQTRRKAEEADLKVRYRVGDALGDSKPGSAEFFFLERYLLFVKRREVVFSGQVHHTPYPAHAAEILDLQDGLVAAAQLGSPARAPDFVHYSPGVEVEIFDLKPAS